MAKILGQDAVEFGRNNPCHLDLGHDLNQDHGQDFFAGCNSFLGRAISYLGHAVLYVGRVIS